MIGLDNRDIEMGDPITLAFQSSCVYKKISGSAITFLVLYVDDILLIGNDVGMLSSVKAWLSKNFSMKDLGEATYILGIRC